MTNFLTRNNDHIVVRLSTKSKLLQFCFMLLCGLLPSVFTFIIVKYYLFYVDMKVCEAKVVK